MSFLLLQILLSPGLIGQSSYFQQPTFHNITVNEGLAHRTTNAVIQDKEGYIWFGTNNGLNRYDGHKMKVYRWDINDPFSLPQNRLTKLFLRNEGVLWILCESGELCWYKSDQDQFISLEFTSINNQSNFVVSDIAEDTSGNIWLISNNTICKFQLNSNTQKPTNLTFLNYQLSNETIFTRLIIDAHNRIWLETENDGIHLCKITKGILENDRQFQDLDNMSLVSQDNNKNIWFTNEHKIYQFNLQWPRAEIKPIFDLKTFDPNMTNEITAITQDDNGQIWVATFGDGLFQLREIGNKFGVTHFPGNLGTEQELTNNHLTDIMVDRYNVLWVASQSGIFRNHLNQKPFYKISKSPNQKSSLINNIVQAIYRDQYLWIGTRNGLSVIDTMTNQFFNYPLLSNNKQIQDEGGISCITKDSHGQVWIGTSSAGLFLVKNPKDPNRLSFLPISGSNSSNLAGMEIINIVEDDWDRIWVATRNDGQRRSWI